jgi:hypothetical protein
MDSKMQSIMFGSRVSKTQLHLPRIADTSIVSRQDESLTYRRQLEHFRDLSLPDLKNHRQKSSFPGLQKFLFTGVGVESVEESKTMKEKLTEYMSITRSQDGFNEELTDIDDEDICRKLQEQGMKLNSLIARKAKIRTITPYTEERISVSKDNQYYGKIKCKGMPLALILIAIIKQGIGYSYLYFSFTAERPDYKNYDKVVLLNKSRMTITFTEKPPKGHNFSKEWIYFGLESERECRITFECSFGKGKVKIYRSGIKEAEG